jgi:hypothetical protein
MKFFEFAMSLIAPVRDNLVAALYRRHVISKRSLLLMFVSMVSFVSVASGQGVTSNDPNFTPSVLASELSGPANGVVFRPPSGDTPGNLVISQFIGNQVSVVNATTGVISTFATQTSPDEVAVRSSDGRVAVKTHPQGPINLYNPDGTPYDAQPSLLISPANPTGLAFDGAGNLYMADAGGEIWKFSASEGIFITPPTLLLSGLNPLEGLAFSAAPLPSGSIYAISYTAGTIYQVPLDSPLAATVATATGSPVGIAVDPLLGDIYTSQTGGNQIQRVSPGGGTPTTFATGFSSTYGLGFDTNGNLYVNDYGAGQLWKFTRASFATPIQTITPGTTQTFTNPTMADQQQTIMIPTSANLNGAVSLQDIFVQFSPTTFDAKLAQQGSAGDTTRFGGGPVPKGTVCVPTPSAGGNCVAVIQKCYDQFGKAFAICPVQEPPSSPDLIQFTSSYSAPLAPPNSAFLIDFDTPPSNQTLTDITTGPFDCCTGKGGSKGLCSKTIVGDKPPVITITTPASNATYSLNQAVPASYMCTDPQVQPTGPTCTGANPGLVANLGLIDTASVGSKTFTVSSTDSLGASGTQSVNYNVVSGPLAKVSPSSVDFGKVEIGDFPIRVVTLTNIGQTPMTITNVKVAPVSGRDSEDFFDLSLCPKTLGVGKSCIIFVAVFGDAGNAHPQAILTITDNVPGGPQFVPLTATVVPRE